MNTRIFKLDLSATPDIEKAVIDGCDKQLLEGFKLASTFIFGNDLFLIFQKL